MRGPSSTHAGPAGSTGTKFAGSARRTRSSSPPPLPTTRDSIALKETPRAMREMRPATQPQGSEKLRKKRKRKKPLSSNLDSVNFADTSPGRAKTVPPRSRGSLASPVATTGQDTGAGPDLAGGNGEEEEEEEATDSSAHASLTAGCPSPRSGGPSSGWGWVRRCPCRPTLR